MRRLCAAAIDGALGMTISAGIVFACAVTYGVQGLYYGIGASALTWWLYSSWAEASQGQATLGARLCLLRVIDSNGGRASFWQTASRQAVRVALGAAPVFALLTGPRELPLALAALLPLSFLFALHNERRQTLADLLGRVVVVPC
ncbi:RDD family protein [Rubrivivax gelatinosus]|uniref:RDD family protein n=1 Tax=Rubrivivax gelatinosus TaxID=28068 RepID=UPI0021755D14|nr:RDD family protein [Rubrivivax gelatinosus]